MHNFGKNYFFISNECAISCKKSFCAKKIPEELTVSWKP